jgi:cell division protease FtsH
MADQQSPPPPHPQRHPPDTQPQPHPFDGRVLIWLLMLFVAYYLVSNGSQSQAQSLEYTEFKQAVLDNRVARVTFEGDKIEGVYVSGQQEKTFTTVLPSVPDEELLPLLEEQNVTVAAKSTQDPPWFHLLVAIAPWLLIIAFFIYASRMLQQRMGGGKDGFMGFGKSKARLFESKDNDVGYDDVAGVEGAKQDLQEIVDFLSDPEKFRKLGAKIPHGIL